LYAHLIAAWVATEPAHREIADGMSAQRQTLGLAVPGCLVAENPKVVPVLAIGAGKSSEEGLRRARLLAQALAPTQTESVLPLEVWRLDPAGEPVDIEIFE